MKPLKLVLICTVLICVLGACAATVDEPCEYCGNSPSRAYKTSAGESFFVCSGCSGECALCHEKATKHYENMLGGILFVCDDCYREIEAYGED